MLETTVDYLHKNLQQAVSRCLESHEVLHVKQAEGESFVVIGAEDWQAIEETLLAWLIAGILAIFTGTGTVGGSFPERV